MYSVLKQNKQKKTKKKTHTHKETTKIQRRYMNLTCSLIHWSQTTLPRAGIILPHKLFFRMSFKSSAVPKIKVRLCIQAFRAHSSAKYWKELVKQHSKQLISKPMQCN